MVKVILLRRPFQQKCIALLEKRAGTRFGVSEVQLLIVRKTLGILHSCFIAKFPPSILSECRQLIIPHNSLYGKGESQKQGVRQERSVHIFIFILLYDAENVIIKAVSMMILDYVFRWSSRQSNPGKG